MATADRQGVMRVGFDLTYVREPKEAFRMLRESSQGIDRIGVCEQTSVSGRPLAVVSGPALYAALGRMRVTLRGQAEALEM